MMLIGVCRHMFFEGVFDQMEGMEFIPEGTLIIRLLCD